jgi:dimethylglycine dehydrogenase
VHEEVYGWERPRFFATTIDQRDHYGFNRTAEHAEVARECHAVQTAAGIMDISSFAKIEVAGADAETVLNRLCANRMPRRDGGIVLTHLLNRRGRIEVEATVVRLGENWFYLTCAAFYEQRLVDLLTFGVAGGETLDIHNVSSDYGALALQGPKAREILAACTDADLSNEGFRWLTAQPIEVAGQPVSALRMSYTGELGWELHGPMAHLDPVYDALWQAGGPLGLTDYGSFAMNSMRMEKMFKGAGELTNEVTLPEADVMRFVKMDKDFVGKPATERAVQQPLNWVCAYLDVDGDGVSDGNGGEAVMSNGHQVGAVSSIAWGHRTSKLLAFAYVQPDYAAAGTDLDVVIMGNRRPARVLDQPVYDAETLLPRA